MPYSFFPKYISNPKPNLLSTNRLNFRAPIAVGGIYTRYRYPTCSGVYTFNRKKTINGSYANCRYSHYRMFDINDLIWRNIRSADISESIIQWKKKIIQYIVNLKFSQGSLILFLSFFVIFSHPAYSQTQGNEPILVVAPIQGPINSEFQEFGPTMTPDAKSLYFYSKRSSKGYTEIFKSERKKDGTWDFPEEVDVLNSPFDDQSPFISRDGKTLLLSSNRDGSIEVMLPDGKVGISRDLYVSNWNGKDWSNPVALPSPINTEEIEENPHLLGDTLLFTRYPFGKPNLAKVYFSQYKEGKWSPPKPLPSPINDNYATIAAAFNDDGSILFFSSNRPGGYGGFDLYMARMEGESFKDIENLGSSINSSEDEAYIVFQQVKKTFLFCRRVEGRSFDLFTASVPKQENIVQKKLEELKKISLDSVYFERASSVLKPESSLSLDAIVDYLHENSDKKMKIIGHTDLTGVYEDNMVLSKERADSVKQYLVSKGIDPKRLLTEGKGPTQPMVQGTDEISSKKNRRTEFVLVDP
ncbi:OmpA family protein [Leptospira sp. 2 VSF19]|uniref:OmpA family protein n=1 Tax=Leptospira soteropolitanensis TaxID=2950025 RepID=A0AAW5VCY6_9LEPT|nr:OmpA family protein [Leptospira soteropolitanensis]MCW7491537.1 OmpA family protein [Leptospira soteropolitanensis]MCW7499121.1 OmpA family protein [Leptospira soteropolitanensis]MCW7521287.1 OmpA family protein [Leptospira soteropolitanensis]MCW7525225.1 OmpA family protein [Leptospira soteropolitanensis]MCW7529092.1 OmpA family protein [Leptospira soteropolitanensis]